MTDWIKWNGGDCPIKSDKTIVEYKCGSGYKATNTGTSCRWSHIDSPYDIIAYRIIEDHEPMTQTREQITAQIDALQKQLDAMPVVVQKYWDGEFCYGNCHHGASHYFDIETINGVPHIHGVAMKEVDK
jgi:hypothetical protein